MTQNVEGMMPDQESILEEAVSNIDMAKLLRDAVGDGLDAIPGIEEMVVGLTKSLRTKMVAFTKEDIEFNFSRMRIFDGIPEDEVDSILKVRVSGENETRVAALIAEAEPVRHALAILLGGNKASIEDFGTGELRQSEASLFVLFAEQMIASLAETIDIKSDYGKPGSPLISNKKEFRQFFAEREFVALAFAIGFEDNMREFEFLLPLEMFDLIKISRIENAEDDRELTEEEQWAVLLNHNVDNLAIPMSVELASLEMSLSSLSDMQIGQTLSVNATKSGLRILDDLGATAFIADVEIHNRRFGLRVARERQKEEA